MSTLIPNLDTSPTYMQFIESSSKFVQQNYVWLKNHYNFPNDMFADFEKCIARIAVKDIVLVFTLAIVWTVIRFLTTKYLFKPFARLCQMSDKDVHKYPESAWRFLFYLCTFIITLYIIFGQKGCDYFNDTALVWKDFSIDGQMPENVRNLYLIEMSFYIHAIHAVLFLDQWKKDSMVMIVHHFITFSLLSLSFATKAHRVGVLVLVLHDGCDVVMEGTKCLLTFKSLGVLASKIIDVLSAIGFLLFLSSWFVCRLYWFPLKAIYTSSEYFIESETKFPFMLVLYSMLWIILVMDFYWFTFIVNILVGILRGKSKIEDNREYDNSDNNVKSVTNGVHKHIKPKMN